MTENPLFNSLDVVLSRIDALPIHVPDNGYCRAKTKGSRRCGNLSCTANEWDEVKRLRANFEYMTQMPDISEYYNDIKRFVEFTHCKAIHRLPARKALESWNPRPVSGSQVISLASSEDAHETEYDSSNTTISSFTSEGVSGSTPPQSPEPTNVVMEKLQSLTITDTRRTLVQSDNGSLNLAEETVTTSETTLVEIDTSAISHTEGVITSAQDKIDSDGAGSMGFGGASLRRAGSVRDNSSIFAEFYKHPSLKKMSEGVLYILKSTEEPGNFKIGWSAFSATQRHNQPNNCYGTNTDIIYETEGGKFRGAFQAERIVQVILRHRNIVVRECPICLGGHREWFRAPEKLVRDTVLCIESFMKMPAYTNQDGEWKLTQEAHAILEGMCSFSIQKLEGRMVVNTNTSDEKPALLTHTEAVPPEEVASEEYPNRDGSESQLEQTEPDFVVSPSGKVRRSKRLGKQTAVVVKQVRKLLSRRSSGTGKDLTTSEAEVTQAGFKEFMDRFREMTLNFRNDFNEEMRRNSEEHKNMGRTRGHF
ncbi:hypothetical protein H634G_11172 [Metarhizium anisopliae BRIP 53293]|uniref:Bacteriophage T5 Orf172 DNA-binding domain-containing protein n=1 Tax=Metarhizium anisopliae BRIP 53293 TaxID=1291518 RepID=A0A0D9NHU5_METAN|nr:hypothetical protein H634G_11172 [Metarhizium anisopliae BRIP 53293]KJK86214.1 hypothetical protein H633G_09935 [Metarhizium anisopliae BRIP 53284]